MLEELRVLAGVVLDGVEVHGPIVDFSIRLSALSVAQELASLTDE